MYILKRDALKKYFFPQNSFVSLDSTENKDNNFSHLNLLLECKYDVVSSECNQATNRMTKVMQLKEGGDETKCEKTITMEKRRCKNKGRCLLCILSLSLSHYL